MQIAKVLGIDQKHDGYIENNEYIISWCYGHLVELSQADAYDPVLNRWKIEDLPIIPQEWKLNVIAGKEKQFELVKRLMHDARVTSLICATDAGREGELIYRLVYEKADCQKPFERLWVSSLEDQAILDGFAQLKDGREYDHLYESAKARAQADWLIGINATRLYSCLYKHPLHIGRVQSPTLAMIVERDEQIQSFQKKKSYKVKLQLGEWEAESSAYDTKEEAEQVKEACQNQPAIVVSYIETEKNIHPPRLFDLTTLQRSANRLYGYTAKETLQIAQTLYEKKLITYPRTDSRSITSDMLETVQNLLVIASKHFKQEKQTFEPSKLVNDADVQDHFALLPTSHIADYDAKALTPEEQTILNLIVSQLLIASDEIHTYQSRNAEIMCGEFAFAAKGKIIIKQGWKETEKQCRNQEIEDKETALPMLISMQEIPIRLIEITEHESTPPQPYTEDTLLRAMETAGKAERDTSLDLEKQGLGTPATRATVIEKLIATGSIKRNKKQLISTQKGQSLIRILPNQLRSATLTATWENQLTQIAQTTIPYEIFMNGVIALTNEIIEQKEQPIETNLFQSDKEIIGKCPICGQMVYESKKNFYCENKECKFVMWKEDHFFTNKKTKLSSKQAKVLLEKGRIKVTGLHSKKTGQTYDAVIVLDTSDNQSVRYQMEFK